MAFIKELVPSDRKSLRIQPTQVVCSYAVDELTPGRKLLQLGDTFNPAHARQSDVHQHHIRKFLGDSLQRRFRVWIALETLELGRLLQDFQQVDARAGVVLDDGHFDFHLF